MLVPGSWVPRAAFTSSALICLDGDSLRASLSVKFDFLVCVWDGPQTLHGKRALWCFGWMTETVTSSGIIGICWDMAMLFRGQKTRGLV